MKIKTTRKNVQNRFKKVFCTGYCDLQYIMNGEEATFYNCGTYGWNFDVYTNFKRDIAITTGYRGMFGKRIPNEIIEEYTKNAKEIIENTSWCDWAERSIKLEENRNLFYEELNNL